MIRIASFIFCLFVVSNTSAQIHYKFDSLLKVYYQKGLFDGTVLIANDTGVVYEKSFGFGNHDLKVPNEHSTAFGIGSMSKSFTAMLVLQLIENGKLNFDQTINHYLPEYRNDIGNKVTIRQLLTHTSGIPSYTALPNVWEDSMQLQYSPMYILKNFGSGDLEFEPGTRYKYGNTGYFMLARIIEQVTGKPFSVVIKDNIFLPLKMLNSGINDNRTPILNKANGYYRLGDLYINESYIYNLNTYGASGVHSTARDLYKFDRALYDTKLLSEKGMKLFNLPHFKVEKNYSYGFGWEFTRLGLGKMDTIETMEHSGAIRGFRSNIFRVPSEGKCVILLSNSANQSAYELFENIMHIFRGRKWEIPKNLLADTLFRVMQKESLEKATEVYQLLKSNTPNNYDFSSYSLELLGERLLMLSMYREAATIFQLAINENPQYTQGYLYMGRAFEKWGKKKEAIQAYKKAVGLNKSSRAGVDAAFQLKHLGNHD